MKIYIKENEISGSERKLVEVRLDSWVKATNALKNIQQKFPFRYKY